MFEKNKKFFNSTEVNSAQPAQKIHAVVEQGSFIHALTTVTFNQSDGEENWTQINFVGNGKIVLTSVSHSYSVKHEFEGNYEGQGVIKIAGKQLLDYIKHLPPGEVTLNIDLPDKMTVRCGRSHAKFQLIQDQSFLDVIVQNSGTFLNIKGDTLVRWLDSFRDFILVDDTRFYALGALLWLVQNPENGQVSLNAVASDSQRLARSSIIEEISVINSDESNVLVPKKTLDELRRVANLESGKNFQIRWHGESLSFAVITDNLCMSSKCIFGKYPPWEAVIPQNINLKIEFSRKSLIDCIRRCMLFTDKNRIIKLSFADNIVKIQSFTPGIKEGEDEIELQEPVEKPFEVNYIGDLLVSLLNNLVGDKVVFNWENVDKPVKITSEFERSLDGFYLMVPTRY